MVCLPVWDKMTWWPQFYDHIIKHQTSNWSLLVKIIVSNLLSSFLSSKISVGIILGGSSWESIKDLHERFTLSLCVKLFCVLVEEFSLQESRNDTLYACMPLHTQPLQC